MKKTILILLVFLLPYAFYGQEIRYVKADNGLIVREEPNKKSKRIGKYKYAEKVEVLEKTEIEFSIIDAGKKVSGEWFKISGLIEGTSVQGYVFSGFLTDQVLKKRIEIKFNDVIVALDHMRIMDYSKVLTQKQKDTAKISMDLSGTPEDKFLKIITKNYKKIEVFQRHENSITIMNEGPHCDLTEWKHFYSGWKKLPYDKVKNSFKTYKYSEKDRVKFDPVNIDELKNEIDTYCGEGWLHVSKSIKEVNDCPSGVSISSIFLKIILTDKNNKITEKIIQFKIPMGC
ncbi:SH3 domain-containing protein [Aquimarina sp. W85]|uniref:SH3 domain-containing protein n=1 Tax=Aquimarina rhodophyticola TaxID=3342246 RepID=UPI00367345DB